MGIGALRQYHGEQADGEGPQPGYITREEHDRLLRDATRSAGDPERLAALEKAAEAAHSKVAAVRAESKEKDERIAALEKALAEVGVEIPDVDELPLEDGEETEGDEPAVEDAPTAGDEVAAAGRGRKKRRGA